MDSENLGYSYEFLEFPLEMYYCSVCGLVARDITLVSCCGNKFCRRCVEPIKDRNDSCPICNGQHYSVMEASDYYNKINALHIYCKNKKKGCNWQGELQNLSDHLNSMDRGCEFSDIGCPLNCNQKVSRSDLSHHLDEVCIKRDFMCYYCDFEAAYEEVVAHHLPNCKYARVPCPNRCGETSDCVDVKSHLKKCPLQMVSCNFNNVGCTDTFKRKDQAVHDIQNVMQHLHLTATSTVEENRKLKEQMQQQEWKLHEQELIIRSMKKALEEQTILSTQLKELSRRMDSLSDMALKRKFVMENFDSEKSKDKGGCWRSPAMYTHLCGYKFCVGVDANGRADARGLAITVYFESMLGEYDHLLSWPARVKFTLELVNQVGGDNFKSTRIREWSKPIFLNCFEFYFESRYNFLEHDRLVDFLHDDTLYFYVSDISVQ